MGNSERKIRRAVKRTPIEERSRYAEEWRRDVAEAKSVGPHAEAEVSRGAMRMATHLRQRWLGRLLLGGLGPVWAVIGWAALALCALAAFLFGGPVIILGLIVFVIAVLVLSRAGVHTFWSYFAMVAPVIVGTAAAAFAWWVLGLAIDAADANTPAPEITHWGGAALSLMGLCAIVFITSVIFAAVRQHRIGPL
ncbi:hypothetical protein [Sinomonas sp. ASV322]|uniref:hypothetical protein n=1 Tax=Sinomonas sp. ASV322 TaxID=3041920 RepID=UPI0027DE9D76|nr:hypothetical protein [Sinomonas sp. ASV322]MDQ4501755.1 hypothetical protein [Sinomonas sp. ASV322]